MRKPLAIVTAMGFLLLAPPVTAAEAPAVYISLGSNPYFQIYSDGELQKFTAPKPGLKQPALVQLERKSVKTTKSDQKELVKLVRQLQVLQSKQDKVFKGTLLKVVGPKGKKSQAYLENVDISDIERELGVKIRNEITKIEKSSFKNELFYPSCYKASKLIISGASETPENILDSAYREVANSPIYVTQEEALSIVGGGDASKIYSANNTQFRISFTPIFTKLDNPCTD